MWTDEQLQKFVEEKLEKHYYTSAAAIASQSYYAGNESDKQFKFEDLRKQIFNMIRLYKQRHSKK